MFVVLGATGHFGSAVADQLLRSGEAVTVVVRDPAKADVWRSKATAVAVANVRDVEALRDAFRMGRRAFLLNPPAPVSTDTDVEERQTASCIVQALGGSGLEKVVAQSTYGAQPGERKGDLSVLYEFEQALAAQPIPVTVVRAAYYMSNWDPLLDAARQGTLPTMFPPELALPMVSATDLGAAAARFLLEPVERTGVRHVEGPERFSSRDAATAFAKALGRSVDVTVMPRERWQDAYRKMGFSKEAAASYAGMTAVSVDGDFETPTDPEHGQVTLAAYIAGLVAGAAEE